MFTKCTLRAFFRSLVAYWFRVLDYWGLTSLWGLIPVSKEFFRTKNFEKMTLKVEKIDLLTSKNLKFQKKIKTSFNVFRTVLCQNFSPLLMTLKFSKIALEKIGIKKKTSFFFLARRVLY